METDVLIFPCEPSLFGSLENGVDGVRIGLVLVQKRDPQQKRRFLETEPA